jgi:hypothetical protein
VARTKVKQTDFVVFLKERKYIRNERKKLELNERMKVKVIRKEGEKETSV